jgi:hypothetical protein
MGAADRPHTGDLKMKNIILFAMLLILATALSVPAFAVDQKSAVPFSSYSGSTATHYSTVYDVHRFRTKTVSVDMTTVAATGTLLVQCGPSSSGPWETCVQQDGTAITGTGSYTLSWDDAAAYVRASWARTTGKISVWFNFLGM